jgi:NADP-dependent 3-hydroxy acid dehydrogenase YdfG
MAGKLDGKVAIITGASSGIGAAMAIALPGISPYVASKHAAMGLTRCC